MTIDACADLVARGDPDRFRAVMAAPVEWRARLFPLYAWNLEVARAPWVGSEPVIAEMRLQWWADVVGNAASGAARAHEVAGPLHHLIAEAGLPIADMEALIEARRWDCWSEPMADLDAYLAATGGGLMWLAARALGAPEGAAAAVRDYGWASGMAAWLRAAPELAARGRQPLPAGATVPDLARAGLARLARARAARGTVPRGVAPALLSGWQAGAVLRRAAAGRAPAMSGAARDGRLLWQAFSGRW